MKGFESIGVYNIVGVSTGLGNETARRSLEAVQRNCRINSWKEKPGRLFVRTPLYDNRHIIHYLLDKQGMRYKEHHKEQTHQQIVERASQEFRSHGFVGMGIAKIMSLLKLTHGGFYAHFKDKEDLIDQAMAFALDQSMAMISTALERGGVQALIEHYLSEMHRDHVAFGCPLTSLTEEQARRSPESKAKFEQKYLEVIAIVAASLPGESSQARQATAHYLMATLSGAVELARAVQDPAQSSQILKAARDHLSRHLASL